MMLISEIIFKLVKKHNSQNPPCHVHIWHIWQVANDHTKANGVIDAIIMATIDCVIDTWNNYIHTFHLTFSILSFLDFRFVEIISTRLISRKRI